MLHLPNFTIAFECTPHDLNNFTLFIFKNFDIPKACIKEFVYLVKIIRTTHHLSFLYVTLCKEKIEIAYVPIILTKFRWITSLYMYARLNLIKTIFSLLTSAMFVGEININIDETVK